MGSWRRSNDHNPKLPVEEKYPVIVYSIQVTFGHSSGASASLSEGSVTIGRDPSNDLCVNDMKVSRSHARLTDNGRDVVLSDLNSTNGTTLNGRRVTEAVIQPGDVIGIGDSQILFAEVQRGRRPVARNAYSQHQPPAPARHRPMQAPAARRSVQERYAHRPVAASSTYSIQVTVGHSSGASASLSEGSVTIGRDPSNDLCVNDMKVSRSHARLTDNGRDVVLSDLNSTNGTTLNGRRVTEAVIQPGDMISIGDSQILFAEVQRGRRPVAKNAYSQHQPPAPARHRPMQAPAARRSVQERYAHRPVAASSTNWGGLLLVMLILGIVGGVAYWFYFMSPKTDEEIATRVAHKWTSDSIDEVAGQAMRAVTGITFGSDFVADQIREQVTWSYSEPDCPRDGRCDIVATAQASSPFSISIPVLLDIDTGAERVDNWEIQFAQASLAGIEGGDVIGDATQVASDAMDRFSDFVSDEDITDLADEAEDVADLAGEAVNTLQGWLR